MADRTNGINVQCSNDLITAFFKIYVLLYADDTVILGDYAESFQNSLDNFHEYCTQWKLTVNGNKT